jgi:hypothetical protein
MAFNAAVLASIPAGTTIARRTGWKNALVAAKDISREGRRHLHRRGCEEMAGGLFSGVVLPYLG